MTSALAIGLRLAPPAVPGFLHRLPTIDGALPVFHADAPNGLFAVDGSNGLVPLSAVGLGGVLTITGDAQLIDDGFGRHSAITANGLRLSRAGLMDRMAGGNKCLNHNANPTDLTGLYTGGDAAAVLSVVDDSAALAAAGLSGICTSGMVYKLDNSAGTGAAQAIVNGFAGTANQHTLSGYFRGTGNGANLHSGYEQGPLITLTDAYQRSAFHTSTNETLRTYWVRVKPGAVVHFILNQMEELPYLTEPVVTTGSAVALAATRTVLPFAGGGFAFAAEMDLRGMRSGAVDGLLMWSDGSNDNRVFVNKTGADLLEASWSRSGESAGGTGPAGTFTQGLRRIYGVMVDNYARLGDVDLGDGTASDLGTLPALTKIGLDGIGHDSVSARAFKYLRRFAVWPVSTGSDPVFDAVKAVAQDWAA